MSRVSGAWLVIVHRDLKPANVKVRANNWLGLVSPQ